MESYDVIVVGLGGMGSAAAYHLAARGQRVLGLERFGPAHDRGSSHGGSRIIRQSYFEDPAYVPLLLRSYDLFEQLERDTDRSLMTLCGGVMVGARTSETFAGSRRSAEQWDLPHEILDATTLRRRFPTMTPREDEVALYEERAGFVRPEATVEAHLLLAERHGADLRFGEPAVRWEASAADTADDAGDDAGVRVVTAQGAYAADRLVVCPGAWAPDLLADIDVPFTVERQVQYWFEPARAVEAFRPERHPIYIWEDAAGTQVYGFPAYDGDRAAKVAFFRHGRPCTPDTLDRRVTAVEVREMADQVASFLPNLPGRFLRAVPCMYTTTPDQHFVIGTHPRHPQVTVACGFSGHGFKFVPVVGEILADLATTGTTAHPTALFDPRRATPTGARTDLVHGGAAR